ncbi:MAG TPA: endolytic transglycosylase MltG [Xanthomonadaceae bacterium]|nr:endolytic transglycosylase MltG [Xanthomonadaceae bacterium]
MFIVSALLAGAFGYALWTRYHAFADAPIAGIAPGQVLVVEAGDSFPRALRKLRAAGARGGHDLEWQALARQLRTANRLQVGEYVLTKGMTPRRLLEEMRDGSVLRHRFTIVEGWNIRELRAGLARQRDLRQVVAGLDDAALMGAMGATGQHPEGRFLPETYHFTRGDSDLDVLKRAHAAMQKALQKAWADRAPELPLKSADEALVLASIVEKETGIASERPQIAGLFVRRLQKGMLLQTDPTVIYGLGSSYDGNLRKRDLLADTPYNTYSRAGLPPTPIAMPGVDALRAATRPASGDAVYFVATGDGSGRHVFSRTLAEHQVAVRAYVQRYREQHRTQPPASIPVPAPVPTPTPAPALTVPPAR